MVMPTVEEVANIIFVGTVTRRGTISTAADIVKMYETAVEANFGWLEWCAAEDWNNDIGVAMWAKFPVVEPPYIGSPDSTDWIEDHFTHYMPISNQWFETNKQG